MKKYIDGEKLKHRTNSESEARAMALEMFAREKYGTFLSERDLKIKIEKI